MPTSRRSDCFSLLGTNSPEKIQRQEKRRQARNTAEVLVRTRSEQKLQIFHSPAKSPVKVFRSEEDGSNTSRNSHVHNNQVNSSEPSDNELDETGIPTLLRNVSDSLLEFFDEEDEVQEREENPGHSERVSEAQRHFHKTISSMDRVSAFNARANNEVRSPRRKCSIHIRTFTNTRSPSKTSQQSKLVGFSNVNECLHHQKPSEREENDIAGRTIPMSASYHSPQRQCLSLNNSPSKSIQTIVRRNKKDLSTRNRNMIGRSLHKSVIAPSPTSASFCLTRQSLEVADILDPQVARRTPSPQALRTSDQQPLAMAVCMQFVPVSMDSFSNSPPAREKPWLLPKATFGVPKTPSSAPTNSNNVQKSIRFHSTSIIQQKVMATSSPVASNRPRDPNRNISAAALKADYCSTGEDDRKTSPILAKRSLGAKKMFGNMLNAFQVKSDES
jgi:hypothetical protein